MQNKASLTWACLDFMQTQDHTAGNNSSLRACDRCRKKKARCDSANYSCTGCLGVGQVCTFDIPPGKRGPRGRTKRRRVNPGAADRPLDLPRPPTAQSPAASPSSSILSIQSPLTVAQRCNSLVSELAQASPASPSFEASVRECTDLFFQYVAPSSTSVHEVEFRSLVDQTFRTSPAGSTLTLLQFTLITAVWAKTSFFVPPELFPTGKKIGEVFLEASRNCLSSYVDADLDSPCADSITVRYLHSNSLHTCARPNASWQVFGEAMRLAQRMRLYDENSYTSLPPMEADKRRRIFWHLYVGDKSLGVLRGMPITLCDYSFEDGLTVAYPSAENDELEQGTNAATRLWQAAAELLQRMRMIKHSNRKPSDVLSPTDYDTLSSYYMRFVVSIDDLPSHLLQTNVSSSAGDNSSTHHTNNKKFIIQITDLQITYHSLKMHLMEGLEKLGYFSVLGERNDLTVLRKTEIAQDMARFLQDVPFWALKVNGEPCAEKIRLVGASLLAIIQEPSPLVSRATRDFNVLLDVLSRLDSKASDALLREQV